MPTGLLQPTASTRERFSASRSSRLSSARVTPLPLAVLAALLAACATATWDGSVASWGTMREVMRDGRTEGRVELDAALRPASVGLGALEGLSGEIAVLGGEVWVARVADGRLECARGVRSGERATLLALSEVSDWEEVRVERDLAPDELVELLASLETRSRAGAPWPFVVEGELLGVEAHVLNGACPFAGEVEPGHEPLRRSLDRAAGKLVGFHAPGSAGVLVHHGQAIHAHVLLESPDVYVGHVDRAGVGAGARVLVPR